MAVSAYAHLFLVGAAVFWCTAVSIPLHDRATGFLDSCTNDNIQVKSGAMFLTAQCLDDSDNEVQSEIDLSKCLQNVNGHLQCFPDGNFYATCQFDSKTTYDKGVLSMYCRNATGFVMYSSCDLNTCITDQNGQLQC